MAVVVVGKSEGRSDATVVIVAPARLRVPAVDAENPVPVYLIIISSNWKGAASNISRRLLLVGRSVISSALRIKTRPWYLQDGR